MQAPIGLLPGTDDDIVDRQYHGFAVFLDMQAGIIDSDVFNAAPGLYAAHLERRAVNPSGGFSQSCPRFSGAALK